MLLGSFTLLRHRYGAAATACCRPARRCSADRAQPTNHEGVDDDVWAHDEILPPLPLPHSSRLVNKFTWVQNGFYSAPSRCCRFFSAVLGVVLGVVLVSGASVRPRVVDRRSPSNSRLGPDPALSPIGIRVNGLCCDCCHGCCAKGPCGRFPFLGVGNQFLTPLQYANLARLGHDLAAAPLAELVEARAAATRRKSSPAAALISRKRAEESSSRF